MLAAKKTMFTLLAIGALTSACSKSKRSHCNTVRSQVTAEMKATEAIFKHASNPQALSEHSRFLKTTASELAGLEIEDVTLNSAVSSYVKALQGLAVGYQKASASHEALAKGDMEKMADEALPGGANMIVYDTMIKSSRKRIAEVCSKP